MSVGRVFQAGPGRGAQARDGAARLGRVLGPLALEGSLGAASLEVVERSESSY